ncbi:MAG: LacI family DNA-binding transcriptional regulator [Chloroflexota bacterium]
MEKQTQSRRVTINDVAERAGVSYQTVSRVLNNHPRVAEKTRDRVNRAIKDLNYYPSSAARDLAARRSRVIGVVTCSLAYYGPTQMLVNIEESARREGYDLIFANVTPTDNKSMQAAADMLRRWAVAGVLVIAPVKTRAYAALLEEINGIPCVQIDIERGTDAASVIFDQYRGIQLVIEHLVSLQHRRIAMIDGPEEWFGAKARHDGYFDAMQTAKLRTHVIGRGDWTAASGYQIVESLGADVSFSALVVANDQMALGAMHALMKAGYRIPEDVSVTGFDDVPEAQFFTPALTTVRQNFSLLGQQGLRQLQLLLEDRTTPELQVIIQPELILRASTATPHTL